MQFTQISPSAISLPKGHRHATVRTQHLLFTHFASSTPRPLARCVLPRVESGFQTRVFDTVASYVLFVCNGFGWHPGLAHKCSAIAVVMFHMLASVRSRRVRQRREVAAAGHISSMALAAEYWAAWFESVSDREQLVS